MRNLPFVIVPAALGAFVAMAEAPSVTERKAESASAPLSGTFTIVTTRRAGDVAGGPIESAAAERIGETVSFGDTLAWWDGTKCRDWSAERREERILPLDDPNLSDTQVPPVGGPPSAGDRRLNRGWSLTCEGKPLGVLLQVDERVLVIPTPSGVTNLILEKPLSPGETRAFQAQLKDMKFFSGEPSAAWDEDSLSAVASYAEYRGAKYRFARTAITENLLDGLKVIADSGPPSIKERFPDYRPKETPDTLTDYRPALSGALAGLPAARPENLKALIKAHKKWHKKAKKSPGQWEPGQVQLGADPKEYVPSDAELVAAEACRRIGRIVRETERPELKAALAAQKIRRRRIECAQFSFRHVDVMGSGRFFYASAPKSVIIEFKAD